jgi:RNA polymerase sigma-70 factor, ECF subfamily
MIPHEDFASLFDEYYPKLYAYIRSQVASQEIAEDITAGTFERAFSRSHTYDADKGSFATWLFRIGRNLVINYYASTSRKPVQIILDEAVEVSTTDPSPEQQIIRKEQRQALLELLSSLPERDQEIISLKFFGRLPNKKIAEVMDLKEKTVSVIVLRALQKLKTRFETQAAL